MYKLVFAIFFLSYSILLFLKYTVIDKSAGLITAIEGYFIFNLFFLTMLYPVSCLHKYLVKLPIFFNNQVLSKIAKIVLLILSIFSIFVIFKISMPWDVISSFFIWIYLYFACVFRQPPKL